MNALRLVEIFESVQGETSFTGLPTTFIRLAGCNLRCTWCDTPYSFGRGDETAVDEILAEVKKNGHKHVCVTGGEPLLQKNVHSLMTYLCDAGHTVSIETGGSLTTEPIDPRVHVILDIKCPGSGMEAKNLWENISRLRSSDEVKFVILNEKDYLYAKAVCEKYRLFEQVENVLFSPVHDQLSAQQLVSWILRDKLPVRLNLQIHKFIWSPETQGV